jgi:hypothetical protein
MNYRDIREVVCMHERRIFHSFASDAGRFSALCAAMLLSVSGLSVSRAVAASGHTIEIEAQHRDEPILIKSVIVGGQAVEAGLIAADGSRQPVTPFQSGEDWLQNTTLVLLNRTDKTIAYIQVALMFPETGDGTPQHPIATYSLSLGRIPQTAAFSGRTGAALVQPAKMQPLSLKPGQTASISLGNYFAEIQANIQSVPFSSITKCNIRRAVVFCDDGLKWDGAYSTPDPGRPGKWNRIQGRYFPGYPVWPPK